MSFSVQFLPVIISAVLLMPLGAFLYSEKGLGKAWMKAIGRTREDIDADKGDMPLLMGLALILSFVTVFLIGVLVSSIGITTWGNLILLVLIVYAIVLFIRLKGTAFDGNFPLFKVNMIATFCEFILVVVVFGLFL